MKKINLFLITLSVILSMNINSFAAIPEYGEEYKNQPNSTYKEIFKDVKKNYWAFNYISEMANRGVLSGYPNGYFYPNNPVTRAEFAKVMCLAGGVDILPVESVSYNDIKNNDWYTPYIEAGKYYLNGYISNGEKYYKPNDNALREDIAVALVKLKGYDTSLYDESILKAMFKDYQSISTGARKYVSVAVENGLISGYEDDTFRGQNSITRAEVSTLLWRAYQYGNENKVFENEELDIPDTSYQTIIEKEVFEEIVPEEEPQPQQNEPKEQPETPKTPEYLYEVITVANNVEEKPINLTATNDGVYYITDKSIYFADHFGDVKEVLNEEDIEYFGEEELTKAQKAQIRYGIAGLGINYSNNHIYTLVLENGWASPCLYDVTLGKPIKPIKTMDYTKYEDVIEFLFDEYDDIIVDTGFSCIDSDYIYDYNKMKFVRLHDLDFYIKNYSNRIDCNSKYFYCIDRESNIYRVDLDGNEELLFGINDIELVDRKPFRMRGVSEIGDYVSNLIYDLDNHSCSAISNNEEIYFYDSNYQCIRMIRHK